MDDIDCVSPAVRYGRVSGFGRPRQHAQRRGVCGEFMAHEQMEFDLTTVDGMIQALYRCISFEPGGEPNWQQFRQLFLPQSQLLKAGAIGPKGSPVLTIDEFIEQTHAFVGESLLQRHGFVETEIMRKTEGFGRIAHIFSTYASRFASGSSKPISRGTNSIQMLRKDGRWWLVSLVWDEEGRGRVLPESYLPRQPESDRDTQDA